MSFYALHDKQLEFERVQNSNSDVPVPVKSIKEENYIQKPPQYLFKRDKRANSLEHVTREKKAQCHRHLEGSALKIIHTSITI